MPSCCVWWEYEEHPDYNSVLAGGFATAKASVGAMSEAWRVACDTRPTHKACFEPLTLSGLSYYAGNYRGAPIGCLAHFRVKIEGDPQVAREPEEVATAIERLRGYLERDVEALSRFSGDDAARLEQIVALAARFLTYFLTIHPYVNGNGHAARFGTWAILKHFGLQPEGFTVHGEKLPYNDQLYAHRRGITSPLERFIFSRLI